ncbi:MAG: calcium-translocating P-type ATPase, PMCA-type [Clostridiales bacterium]|jgi:Ca2+-transporting ATPase|nr:calcium-translocating P-type ATPase, PMCA-type [Clostridiales bacterium]
MDAFRMSAPAAAAELGTDAERGLNEGGVEAAREKYGANVLTKAKRPGLLTRVVKGLFEPMMIILLVALAITLAVNFIKLGARERFDYTECAGILAAITLSVIITVIMEGRSIKAFDALNRIGANASVKVIRNGAARQIPASELVAGDVIKFGVGDKIPADCRLCESTDFEVDESPLTGESVPVKKDARIIINDAAAPLAERKNMVYGGCFVTGGAATGIVTAVGDATEIGGIAKELGAVDPDLTPLQRKLDRLGKIIAVLGGAAAAFVFAARLIMLAVTGGLSFDSVQEIFITSIVLIVASVPEGLPTIVAVSLALNVVKMAKQNALVKRMAACETVGAISVICSDKTGTLTENRMTLSHVCTFRGDVEPQNIRDARILNNFCLNTTADVSKNDDGTFAFIGSPTECALLVAYRKARPELPYGEARRRAGTVRVFPFSSELKRMTTLVREGGETVAYVKGAPEIVLGMCAADAAQKKRLLAQIGEYQSRAKRVIALAHAVKSGSDNLTDRAAVESDLRFDGFAVISDPVRRDVRAAVDKCRAAGVEVKMLTGDDVLTARAVAEELCITVGGSGVYHANQIENMSDAELKRTIGGVKVVARSTPLTKLRIVKILKELGGVVAVTGDGINDAPAIKHADVGIAMGIAGTEVSKEASDIVLLDDSFSTIVKSVHWGRGVYENFQRFIMFQLSVNLSAVLVTVVCILFGTDAPFNALQLLWINLIMDGPPALTLGLEPIHGGLMKRKPLPRGGSIVTKRMFMRITANGAFIAAFMICQALTNFLGVWVEREKTALFTLFVVFQLFNAFNARELGSAGALRSLWRNKLMLAVMGVTFALQIVITQFGSRVFDTVPLSAGDWVKLAAAGFSIILFNELYKYGYKVWRGFSRCRAASPKLAENSE